MTAIFTEGFETICDQSDMLARGMLQTAVYNGAAASSVAIPSRTGYPGKGLFLRGPYSVQTVPPIFQANQQDFGLIPLGISAYAAWQAGGFSVGFSASFNAGNFIEIAPGESQQLCYDGAQYYWAIYRNSSSGAWGVAYSTDLQNWTPTLSTTTLNQNSTITVSGSGMNALVMVGNSSNYLSYPIVYTNNMGLTWNTTNGSVTYRTPVYTNGATALYVTMTANASIGMYPAYSTTWSGTPTQLTTVSLAPAASTEGGFCKLVGNYLVAVALSGGTAQYQPSAGVTSGVGFCLASADPTQAANWTVCPKLPFEIIDLAYFNGNIVAAGYGGIYYLSVSNPVTWMPAQGFIAGSAFSIFSIACNNSVMVAVGQDTLNPNLGAFYTSTDGIHWTKQNQFMYVNPTNANTAFCAFTDVMWDGARFIATGGMGNGMIVTSTDGLIWECIFVTDYPEQTATNTFSFPGVYSGQLSAAGLFTPWSAINGANIGTDVNGLGITCSTQSSGVRTVYLIMNYGSYTGQGNVNLVANTQMAANPPNLGQQPGASLTHYYELIFTAGALANNFTLQWAIDGQVQPYTSALSLLAANNDTGTMQLYFSLPRHGNFNVIDDIYFTTANGLGNSGRLGPQSVFAVDPNSVVAGGFSNTSGTRNNAQVANEELINSDNYLYASAAGTQDVYGSSNQVPANYVVRAVQVDAFMTSLGTGKAVTGQVGVKSGATSKAGSTVTPPAAGIETRSTLLMETDPNTGAAFTNAALNALDLTITRTT